MFNLTDLIDYVKVPGTTAKMERIGDVMQYVLPWLALSFVAFTGNAELAWTWLYGCLGAAVVVHVIKKLMNFTKFGKRPNGGDNSFPSGHTSGAFSGAAFFLFAFGPTAAAIPFVLAFMTGWSRVLAKHHWWRDVIAGALISTLCVYFAFYGV